MAQHEKGPRDPDCCEVAVVSVAAGGDEAVLAGAEGGALGIEGLVSWVGVGCAKKGFVGVDTLPQDPEDGVGEALGYVGGG